MIQPLDFERLTDASSEDTLNAINRRIGSLRWVTPLLLVVIVAAGYYAWIKRIVPNSIENQMSSNASGIPWIIVGAIIIMFLFLQLVNSILNHWRTTTLLYDMDGPAGQRFDRIRQAAARLAGSQKLWRLTSEQATSDWKHNAGANVLTRRVPLAIGYGKTPYLKSNANPVMMSSQGLTLIFYPDRLFVWDGKRYGAISYNVMRFDGRPSNFREAGKVPRDATVTSKTWRYVNKDGGPDRRFRNNREIPICLYGVLVITSTTGVHVEIMASNPNLVSQYVKTLTA